MRYIAAVLGFLTVLTTEARVGDSSESEFCTETSECLLYTPVCQAEDYEVRWYEKTKWVTTRETSRFMDLATYIASRRLSKYITGANENGVSIAKTSPMIINSKNNPGWFESCTYTMSFLLPSQHQLNPPEPTDRLVYITEEPDMLVYVHSYGMLMIGTSDSKNLADLKRSLDAVGASYEDDHHYSVGYDSRTKLTNRHNEVWLVAEGQPMCPTPATPAD